MAETTVGLAKEPLKNTPQNTLADTEKWFNPGEETSLNATGELTVTVGEKTSFCPAGTASVDPADETLIHTSLKPSLCPAQERSHHTSEKTIVGKFSTAQADNTLLHKAEKNVIRNKGQLSSVNPASELASLQMTHFGFHAKTSHDAHDALLHTRSETFCAPSPRLDIDVWKRPPPDFRCQVYAPKPPKRNTVDSQQPWLYGTIPGQREKVTTRPKDPETPVIFRERTSSPLPMVTRFRIARPFTAKKQFIKEGSFPVGFYQAPTPHDFRQYPPIKSLGLDEFETTYERDPYNLHFKTKRLNTVHGISLGPPERDLVPGRQMAPPLSAKAKWDARLIMNKTRWPQREAAFTRHRLRHRDVHSAFMERVERHILTKWAAERRGLPSLHPQSLSFRQKTV